MCLFSRDKRREVTIGLWQTTSDCFFNCISSGTGIHLVEKRSCRHCNVTASIQLCKPDNPVGDYNFNMCVLISGLFSSRLTFTTTINSYNWCCTN